MQKVFNLIVVCSLLIYGLSYAGELAPNKKLIVGVFDFSSKATASKVAEVAEKLKQLDNHFESIIVAEIHANTYGVYFTYRSNEKINTPQKLTDALNDVLKEKGNLVEGHHISNSSIIVK